jgi:hypothetical protein
MSKVGHGLVLGYTMEIGGIDRLNAVLSQFRNKELSPNLLMLLT